jgi:tetratricopeptide (TPR) repeat protein
MYPDEDEATLDDLVRHLRAIERVTRWPEVRERIRAAFAKLDDPSQCEEFYLFANGAPIYRPVGSLPAYLVELFPLSDSGAYDKLLAALKGLEMAYPHCPHTARQLAETYAQTGDFEGAAYTYGRAIALEPGEIPHYSNLARCYIQLGRLGDAADVCLRGVGDFERARAKNPSIGVAHESWDLRISAARMVRDLGRLDDAIYYAEDCVVLVPRERSCLETLAKMYNEAALKLAEANRRSRDAHATAVQLLEAAVDLDRRNGMLQQNLAGVRGALAKL